MLSFFNKFKSIQVIVTCTIAVFYLVFCDSRSSRCIDHSYRFIFLVTHFTKLFNTFWNVILFPNCLEVIPKNE